MEKPIKKKKSRGGRPLLPDDERRKIYPVMYSKIEIDKVKKQAEKLGLPYLAYIREVSLNPTVIERGNYPMILRELGLISQLMRKSGNKDNSEEIKKIVRPLIESFPAPDRDKKFMAEVNRIGTNLNQIAYLANASKSTAGISGKLDEIRIQLREIINKF